MMTHPPKRLIEVSLPLAAISEQSAREKSIRHGHISTLHIWWARRPLAAMRAAIFASLIPAPEDDAEREKLEELIRVIVDWDQVKDGNSPKIEEARELIRRAYLDQPPRLLDPFMGGGATGLEALRLGCETHAVELNPVAHLIELCTLVYPQKYGRMGESHWEATHSANQRMNASEATDYAICSTTEAPRLPGMEEHPETPRNPLAADVRKWGQWVLERAREQIGHLYANPAGKETIVGYLWARTVRCPNPACRAEMPLVRQWWLANTGGRKVALQPVVDRASKQLTFEVVDLVRTPLRGFDPNQGTSNRGDGTCLVCSQVADANYIRSEGQAGRTGEMPLAVIFEQDETGKGYRAFTDQDLKLLQQAMTLRSDVDDDVPDEAVPLMSGVFNVPIYGIKRWGDLFNVRQALALVTFSRQLQTAHSAMLDEGMDPQRATVVVTYLAVGIDRLSDFLSTLCTWTSGGEFVGHTFVRQALAMVWDYAEVNPFSRSTGNWTGALEWVARVIEHTALSSDQPATTQQGTATRLPYPDCHFDAVVTDPPYYNAVPYADLSDFFYVWLKRSIGFLYPNLFRTPLTPKAAEIAEMAGWDPKRYADKDKAFYEREMTRAFTEARRVLCADGIFVVVFAHKSTAAWETLLNSLLDAGLVVTASWPLHTERPGRLRAQESAALASSIFIVCRVRDADKDGYLDDVREELATTIRERLDFFWAQGIRGADFFISAIGPAVSIFGRYGHVYRLDGSEVKVGELLDLVQSLVSEYALDRILNTSAALSAGGAAVRVGAVDAATRYYILHRWAYASEKIPFDDAMRLAMALGADVTTLMERRGILKQSGETVSLLGPKERGKLEDLGLPDRSGRQADIVDVLHRAVTLWEKGDREALARFLAEAAAGRDDQVRLVSQTLVDILPPDDGERRLLEGFLAGRESLPEAPRQERLI
jgi:adenine-specific DNA methylase